MKKLVLLGHIRIKASGTVNLFDGHEDTDTSQDLSDQSLTDTAALYIKIRPGVKSFDLAMIKIGYVEGATTNDLANVHLLEGGHATDQYQQEKILWSSGALAETPPSSGPGHIFRLNPLIPVLLDTKGQLVFLTEWSTAVMSATTAEFFYIKVYGYVSSGSPT